MEIIIEQLTPWSVALDAARETMHKEPLDIEPSEKFLRDVIDAEHSVIRGVVYRIRMIGIPYFVSVHLVRHKFGVEHFVSSQRTDRTGETRDKKPQDAPVNHTMIINAHEILFISRRRLCGQASAETRKVWQKVVDVFKDIDPIFAEYLVPMCVYRGGRCHEITSCGRCKK